MYLLTRSYIHDLYINQLRGFTFNIYLFNIYMNLNGQYYENLCVSKLCMVCQVRLVYI